MQPLGVAYEPLHNAFVSCKILSRQHVGHGDLTNFCSDTTEPGHDMTEQLHVSIHLLGPESGRKYFFVRLVTVAEGSFIVSTRLLFGIPPHFVTNYSASITHITLIYPFSQPKALHVPD